MLVNIEKDKVEFDVFKVVGLGIKIVVFYNFSFLYIEYD